MPSWPTLFFGCFQVAGTSWNNRALIISGRCWKTFRLFRWTLAFTRSSGCRSRMETLLCQKENWACQMNSFIITIVIIPWVVLWACQVADYIKNVSAINFFPSRSSSLTKNWFVMFTTVWRPAPTQKLKVLLIIFSDSNAALWMQWEQLDRKDQWRRSSVFTMLKLELIRFPSTQPFKTCFRLTEWTMTRQSK